MKPTELATLRRRAREYGLTRRSGAGIKRLRALWSSGQHGLREPAAPKQEPTACERVDETGARWVVALCRPSLARSVAEDLNELGYRAYCPIGKRVVYRARQRGSQARKRRIHEFAVFGRYLFVGELDEPLQASIHGGIVEVLSDFDGALAINPAVIRALNDAELAGQWDKSKVRAWEDVPFRRGDRVRIGQGSPLEGFLGIVEQITKTGIRVSVAHLFGRRTSVLVPGGSLVADAAE